MAELADLCMRYKTAKRLALEENLVYMLFEDLDVSLKEYHQYVPPFTTSDERTRQQQLSTHRLRSERSRNILKHLGCILQLLNCIIFNSENVPMSLRDEFLTTHLSGGLCKLFGYLLHDFCPSYWRQRGPPQAYSHEQVSESKLWIKKCLRGKQSAPKAPKVLSRGKFLSEPFTPTDMRISPFSFASSYLFHEEDSSCFSSSASTIKSGETFSIDEGSSDTDSMSGEKIVQDTYCSQQESTLGETTLLLKSNTEVSINFVRGKVGRRHGILLSELPKEGRFEGVETLYKSNAMARGGGNHQNYTEHKKQAGLEDRAINLRAPVYQFSSEQAADVGDISLRDDSTKYEYHKRVEEEKQSYNDCYSYDPLNPPNVRRKGCASNTFRRLIRILKQGHPSRFRDATKPLLYLYRSEEKLNYLKGLSKAEITQKKPAYEFLKIEGHRDDFLRNYCFSDKSKFSRTRMIEKPHQPLKLGLVRSENQFRDDLENFLREEGIRTSKKDRDRLLAIGKRLGVVDTVDDISKFTCHTFCCQCLMKLLYLLSENDNSMKTLHHVPYTSDQVTVAMREREGDSITSGVSELKHMADAEDENDRIQRLYENDDLRHLENNGEQQLSEHKPKDVNDRVEWGLIKSLRYSAFTLLLSYLYLLDDVKVYGGTAKLNFASLICDVPESILRSSFHYLIVNVSECLRASTLQMCSYIMDKTDNSSDKKLLNNAESEAEDIDSEEEDSSDCPFRIITGKERIHGSCLVHRLAVVAKLALIIVECNPDLRILENDLTSLVRDLHDHDEVMDLLDDIQKNVHSILLEALEDVSELVKIMKQNLSH